MRASPCDRGCRVSHWRTLLAIDFDKHAVECYRANFPGVQVEHASVADWIDRLPEADVILGGPPCQPFSNAGKGDGESDKRDCIPDFLAAVRRVRPRMFLMENVPGLLGARHARYIGGVVTEMESMGYAVDVRELDAVNFGVPQFRTRVWFWGIRSDVHAAGARHRWPVQTHTWPAPVAGGLFGEGHHLEPGVTVREALGLNFGEPTSARTEYVASSPKNIRGPSDLVKRQPHAHEDEPMCTLGAHTMPLVTGDRVLMNTKQHRSLQGIDEPSGTLQHDDRRELLLQSHADPAQSIDTPSPTLRSGGAGHDGCCLRVIGGGSNPHFIGEARTDRDITDEPSTTIPCGDRFGNVLPVLAYDHGVAELDKPSPALKAGGNFDDGGKQGGGCPPQLQIEKYRWSDAMLRKHPPAAPAAPAATVQAKWFKGGAEGLLAVTEWKHKGDLWVRRLAPLECARLQSMPDDFIWPASIKKTHAYRIIGNGWASLMAKRMSESLAAADPKSVTVIDLFCGGGLGAVGWHGRAWELQKVEAGAA